MDGKVTSRWILACVCLFSNGCTVCELAMRTVRYEPAAFPARSDRERSRRLYRDWAEEVWQQEQQQCSDHVRGREFGMGFRDGFVDIRLAGCRIGRLRVVACQEQGTRCKCEADDPMHDYTLQSRRWHPTKRSVNLKCHCAYRRQQAANC